MAGIASLTDRDAVLKAMREYDGLGRDPFLERYGFGRAKWWYVLHEGRQYDSKAIVGTAIRFQTGQPLRASDFTGGEGSVVRKLRSFGFMVVRVEISEDSSRLPEEVDATFPEGMRTAVTVNRAERSAAARLACIDAHGTRCVVCGMSFEETYGSDFSGLIHVHHLNPLSGQTGVVEVDPRADLRPVCPNCHAAIHYDGANRPIDELKAALAAAQGTTV